MELRIFSLFIFITFVVADTSTDTNDAIDEVEETTEHQTQQCHKSVLHKKDLQSIFDYVENSLSIRAKINETIQSEAVPVRDKYIQRVNNSIQWFIIQPERLKHILEGVAETRQYVTKFAAAIEKSLMNLPNFTSKYQQKLDKKKRLINKFLHYKRLCEINCGPQKVEYRRAVPETITSEQYCGSIAEVHNAILERLENFLNKFNQDIHQEIIKVEQHYNMKINTRVKGLEEVALNEFAGTMYNILQLEDLYHHLKKELQEFNANWEMELNELNIKVDISLLKLNNAVMDFVNKCKTCHKVISNREQIVERQQVHDLQGENLLDSLIKNQLNEISNYGTTELVNIFHELDEILKKVNTENILISHLNPIQKEIMELVKEEIDAFNNLRMYKVKENIDLMKKLIANTKVLPDPITKNVEQIQAHNVKF